MDGSERTERLLALLLVHDMRDAPPGEKALALSRAGFSPSEIGSLLGAKPNTIAVQLTRAKSASRKTKNPAKKKARLRKRG